MLWRSGYGFCAAPRISCGENRERHAVRERVYGCPQKRNRIGALRWRTLRSRIRFNPERIRWAVQGMVRRMNVLWAVNANWNDDGWNVETNSPSNPNSWNAGNEFVSRNPALSPLNDSRRAGLSLRCLFASRLSYDQPLQCGTQFRRIVSVVSAWPPTRFA